MKVRSFHAFWLVHKLKTLCHGNGYHLKRQIAIAMTTIINCHACWKELARICFRPLHVQCIVSVWGPNLTFPWDLLSKSMWTVLQSKCTNESEQMQLLNDFVHICRPANIKLAEQLLKQLE